MKWNRNNKIWWQRGNVIKRKAKAKIHFGLAFEMISLWCWCTHNGWRVNMLLQATQATAASAAAAAPPAFSILIKLHFWMIFFRAVSFRTNSEKWTWVQMLNTSHKVIPMFFLLTARKICFFRLHQASAIYIFAYLCHSNHTICVAAWAPFSLSPFLPLTLSVSHRHRSYFFF